jgi:hypothetical protein
MVVGKFPVRLHQTCSVYLDSPETTGAMAMENATSGLRVPSRRSGLTFLCRATLISLTVLIPTISRAQTQQSARPAGGEPKPEPAIPAILAAFDKYEVVAMPEDHGMRDLDELIFALIRNPAFAAKVNDVVVESGNSLYQSVLDRYVGGEDVPLTEVRKVWRNTTQPICGVWGFGFFEQL